jgi:hypothetical protein
MHVLFGNFLGEITLEEIECCRVERFFWPALKPIDGGAVHDCWKVSKPSSECVSNWLHADDEVQVEFAFGEEDRKSFIGRSVFWHNHFLYNFLLVLSRIKVRNFPAIKEVANVFKLVIGIVLKYTLP